MTELSVCQKRQLIGVLVLRIRRHCNVYTYGFLEHLLCCEVVAKIDVCDTTLEVQSGILVAIHLESFLNHSLALLELFDVDELARADLQSLYICINAAFKSLCRHTLSRDSSPRSLPRLGESRVRSIVHSYITDTS